MFEFDPNEPIGGKYFAFQEGKTKQKKLIQFSAVTKQESSFGVSPCSMSGI
jgi:hypothetical protein